MGRSRPSNHQQAIREAKRIEGGICAVCGSIKNLHGHHLFEYRLGGEPTNTNIVVFCDSCHRKAHRGCFEIERIIF